MKTTKMMAYGFMILFALGTALALAPEAAAQGVALQIQPAAQGAVNSKISGRLAPETGQGQVDFKFTVSIPNTSGYSPAVCPLATITVNFEIVKAPDYASTTLSPKSTTVQLGPNSQASADVTTTLIVVVSRKAPAFQSDTYTVQATANGASAATSGCTVTGTPQAKSDTQVKNDYLPILEYVPAKYIQKTGQNKDVLFPIHVTNFGNGQTRVTTTVTQPNKNKLDSLLPPSVTTLNTILDTKTDVSKDMVVTGRTPHANGYTNQLYTFTVSFEATAVQAGDNILKDTQQISLSVQVQGVYVPGFDPAMAIGGLGVAFLLVGMRRRDA